MHGFLHTHIYIESMLFECGIPSLYLLQQKLTINYFLKHRHYHQIDNNTNTYLFSNYLYKHMESNYSHPIHDININNKHDFFSLLRRIASDWNVHLMDPTLTLKAIKSQYKISRFSHFHHDSTSTSLRTHRHTIQQPIYLTSDPLPVLRARARLRFHRSYLHSHSKQIHISHQPCPHCEGAPDTLQHLLQCPFLIDATIELTRSLQHLNIKPNIHMLVGNYEHIKKHHREEVNQLTGEYLTNVLVVRNL